MKSTEFILEAKLPNNVIEIVSKYTNVEKVDISAILKFIKIGRKCKSYINQVSNPLELYRGIRSNKDILKKSTRLDDRKPLGMSQERQELINKFFIDEFNEPFRYAIFCSGWEEMASHYGMTYLILPIGDFTFLWSPKYEDLNEEIWELQRNKELNNNSLIKLIQNGNYTTQNLEAAIASWNEIMIRCKGYYAINEDQFDNKMPKKLVSKLLIHGASL